MMRVAAVILLLAPLCLGFPEMVRHGYVNCVACHMSPDGGGVLTPYGRSLSKELLSIAGSDRIGSGGSGVMGPFSVI